MRILVTGSNGRVGRRLIDELLSEGHEVVGFDMAEPKNGTPYDYIQGNLANMEDVTRAVERVDAVVHLGAYMSWVNEDAPKLFEANVIGTYNLLHALRNSNISRLVVASTGEVYPESSAEYLPVDEHHPRKPSTMYGMTKLLCEEMTAYHERKYGLPSVIIRVSHTQDASELLDPDSFFSGPRFFLNSKIRQQKMFGNQKNVALLEKHYNGQEKLLLSRGEDGTPYRMCICETRDMTQGMRLALQSDRAVGQTIAVGPDEAISFDEAIRLMHEATGLPIADVKLSGSAVNYTTSNAKAKELLGFRPQWNFQSMLKEAVHVYRERINQNEI